MKTYITINSIRQCRDANGWALDINDDYDWCDHDSEAIEGNSCSLIFETEAQAKKFVESTEGDFDNLREVYWVDGTAGLVVWELEDDDEAEPEWS